MSTNYLVVAFPQVQRFRIPVSRDQAMLLMIAVNEILLGVETYLAHSISGTIVLREWIPIVAGPVMGFLLLFAGLIALRNRMAANIIGTLVFLVSILVGILGSYFHILRAVLPSAPPGSQVSVPLLVWGPPILGPITFALIGILGLSAAWQEDPPDSGRLILPGGVHLQLPYSKTRAYFFLIGLGMLITVLSSVLDHTRSGFVNPLVWIPTILGLFTTAVILTLGFLDHPTRFDLVTFVLTMLVILTVGVLGSILHISHDLTTQGAIVGERLIRSAPVLAPMLFSNMGLFALLILFDSAEGEHFKR